MTVLVVETWNLRPDKIEEFDSFLERWKNLIDERPDLFEELKAWNSYRPMFSAEPSGMNLWEFDSIDDREKFRKKLGSEEVLIELVSELGDYIVSGSHNEDMWGPVLKLK